MVWSLTRSSPGLRFSTPGSRSKRRRLPLPMTSWSARPGVGPGRQLKDAWTRPSPTLDEEMSLGGSYPRVEIDMARSNCTGPCASPGRRKAVVQALPSFPPIGSASRYRESRRASEMPLKSRRSRIGAGPP